MLHDALPLVTTLHIEKASQLRIGLVSNHLRDISSVTIYNLFYKNNDTNTIHVDEDIATNSVHFLSRLPNLQSVTFWGRWGDSLCSLKSRYISEDQRFGIYHLMDSFSGAFDCRSLPHNLQINGLSCPNLCNDSEGGSCKVCKRLCKKFPLERTLDVDLCLSYTTCNEIIKARKGGEDYLHSETRLMQLLGKGVIEDASLIIAYCGSVKSELKITVESSRGVDVTKLKEEDIRNAIMKQHSNTVAYLSEESFDLLKTTIRLPISNDLLDPDAIRVENLDRMVKHIMEETDSVQKSINQMYSLLACEDTTQDSTKQLVVETGVLLKLVQFLSRDNDSDLQFAALKVLIRVSFVGVIIMGAIPLVRLLSSPHTELPLNAAWALGSIVGESRHCRDLVLQAGAIHPLLKLLEDHHQESDVKSVRRTYVWTLCNLCRGKPKPDFNIVSPALPVLKKMLYHSEEAVVMDACWVLSHLSDGPNIYIQAIINAFEDTDVRRFVELLNHPSASLQAAALGALGNIATGHISQTQLIRNNELPCLLDLFVNHSFSELKELLQSLRSNRTLYDQYYGKVITVPCKISDSGEQDDKHFNIVKANSYGSPQKTKNKKYEFLFVGKFCGQKQSDGVVACRVASSVIEPYFGEHTAGDIRKICRQDKERAYRLVNQSSCAFHHDFCSLSQFQIKLMLTPDEFYAKLAQVPTLRDSTSWMVDIGNPPLLILRKL